MVENIMSGLKIGDVAARAGGGVDTGRFYERRGLIDVVGHAPGPGQAVLYGTSEMFLEKLGLRSLDDLPPLADHVPPADVVEALERPFRPEDSSSDSRS